MEMVGVPGFEPGASCSQSLPDNPLETFISERKATKGLTVTGEVWLRDTLGRFLPGLPVPIDQANRNHLLAFLALYEGRPWRKHGMYRALRTFWRWASRTFDIPNPMQDRWGNPTIEPPKLPNTILYTQTPETVATLIAAAETTRDKAMIALLADSGARRSELVSIKINDVDLTRYRIKVMGKGGKEGWLIFGDGTKAFLETYIAENSPAPLLFPLAPQGMRAVFRRLEKRTGLKANPHSFRRGFATELRRKGVSELDIAQLGRWSSLEMVRRYTKAYSFDDAAMRYRPMVD
jgi:integrase